MTVLRRDILKFGLTAALGSAVVRPASATVYRYWTDPHTGLAIGGFDPVAYFVEKGPVSGNPKHEFNWRGAAWQFASAANCAAFIEAADVYAPQFGGYSVVGIARGFPAQGNPNHWVIDDQKLYLFHSPAHMAVWKQDPQAVMAQARENWPKIQYRLKP